MDNILISIIGATTAVMVALIGTILSYKHNQDLQIYKLKEEHYIAFIEALHNLATDSTNSEYLSMYTYCRDKLLIIGSEFVVKDIILYENEAFGIVNPQHDKYLTNIIKSIRKDLKIKDKNYPDTISLKKPNIIPPNQRSYT